MSLTFEEIAALVQEASGEFDQMSQDRHATGAAEYGEYGFLKNDTLQMALEELVDMSNYARYTFIRIRLIQKRLEADASTDLPGSFTPVKEQ